jgi:DNA processing protein
VLNAVPSVGNRAIRRLVERYRSARAVFSQSGQELRNDGALTDLQLKSFSEFPSETFLVEETRKCARHGIKVITCHDSSYPDLLREIPDSPVLLYIKGDPDSLNTIGVAMVGSRSASVCGLTAGRRLAAKMAEAGLTVVSGLARGIDTAAHLGVLDVSGKTVAVLGSGLLRIYPAENTGLADRIVARGGAVVSEFPLDTRPRPHNFPRRNRIISGLTRGVIVVEAAARSGALITADFALEQGRDIYALPGSIDNPAACGTLELIKQGAKMVTCTDDVLEDYRERVRLELGKPALPAALDVPGPGELSGEEGDLLSGMPSDKIHFDHLCQASGLPVNRISALLVRLELQHKIRQFPGKYFQRTPHG